MQGHVQWGYRGVGVCRVTYSGAIEGHIQWGYQESYTCSVGLSGSHTVRLFSHIQQGYEGTGVCRFIPDSLREPCTATIVMGFNRTYGKF